MMKNHLELYNGIKPRIKYYFQQRKSSKKQNFLSFVKNLRKMRKIILSRTKMNKATIDSLTTDTVLSYLLLILKNQNWKSCKLLKNFKNILFYKKLYLVHKTLFWYLWWFEDLFRCLLSIATIERKSLCILKSLSILQILRIKTKKISMNLLLMTSCLLSQILNPIQILATFILLEERMCSMSITLALNYIELILRNLSKKNKIIQRF